MARKILAFDNGGGATSDFPNGYIKDNPGDGTGTKINRKSNNDMQQAWQRIMVDAGVTPNGLEESVTNGFQLVQALNTLYCRRFSGMAEAAGTPAGTYVPVIMSGMQPLAHGYLGGYFFYNGLFYYAPAWSNTTAPTIGHSIVLTLGTLDAQPVVTGTGIATTVTPGAGSFNYEDLITWSDSVGIDALQADVAIGAWANVSAFYTGWAAYGVGSNPQYCKDGMGRVRMRGKIGVSSVFALQQMCQLPAGFRPVTQDPLLPCVSYDTSAFGVVGLQVDKTTGDITFAGTAPTTVNYYIDLSGISFLTT